VVPNQGIFWMFRHWHLFIIVRNGFLMKGLYEMVQCHVAKSIYPVKDLIFVIRFPAMNIPKFEGTMHY
jgi:hypothetical protein